MLGQLQVGRQRIPEVVQPAFVCNECHILWLLSRVVLDVSHIFTFCCSAVVVSDDVDENVAQHQRISKEVNLGKAIGGLDILQVKCR